MLERLPDGRLNIIVEGRDRFRLVELTSGRSFHTGVVEPVADENDPGEPDAAARAVRLLQALATAVGVEVDLPSPDSPTLSFDVAARVELELDDEQELLELRSERERLSRLGELLAEAADRARIEREAQDRARTNGKLPHPPKLG